MLMMFRHHLHPNRMRSRAIWAFLGRIAGALVVGCFLQTAAAGTSANPDSSASTGRRMFLGENPLQGAIVGHAEPLPARMVACANCHLGKAGLGSDNPFGPSLDRPRMMQRIARRGGPPSVFTPTSFCRTLRTGVDPAYILITRQMPRYTLSDDQCLGLWRYLMETGH